MTKSLTALAVLAVVATSAFADEVYVGAGKNDAVDNSNIVRLGYTKNYEGLKLGLAADLSQNNTGNYQTVQATVGKTVYASGPVSVDVKAGPTYFTSRAFDVNGFGALAGVAVSYDLNKNVAFYADTEYRDYFNQVAGLNGWNYTGGLKYKF
jgi:hypothetical protein